MNLLVVYMYWAVVTNDDLSMEDIVEDVGEYLPCSPIANRSEIALAMHVNNTGKSDTNDDDDAYVTFSTSEKMAEPNELVDFSRQKEYDDTNNNWGEIFHTDVKSRCIEFLKKNKRSKLSRFIIIYLETARVREVSSNGMSGNIVTIGIHMYFVPNNTKRIPLRWEYKQQHFSMFSENPHDQSLRLLLQQNTASGALIGAPQVNKSVSCCALYGVVPLGPLTSVLLYVTESERVATLSLHERHEIYAVKRFDWMLLPECAADLSESDDPTVGKKNKSEGKESNGNRVCELSPSTIAEYCAVIDNFCTQANRHAGGSHFFYSPTINIALDPSEMFGTSRLFSKRPSSSFVKEELSSQHVFQWNILLLDAFQLQNETREEEHERPNGISLQTSLYVPSFIRGHVEPASADGVDLLILSRLSFRWSGTRYNRRGLDPSGSGITANFSIATLWVFPSQQKKEKKNKGTEDNEDCDQQRSASGVSSPLVRSKRVATYQIMRGSVPCRWSQPANLRLKPKITFSPPSSSSEELSSHIAAMGACVPGIKTLHCLDTISLRCHERPLSEAFEEMVRKYHEGDAKQRSSICVLYTKYDVVERMDKKISYDQMGKEVRTKLQEAAINSNNDYADFSQWFCEKDEKMQENPDDPRCFSWRQLQEQKYYVRVSCLDCLDRTNLAQSMIVLGVLPHMICYVLELENVDVSQHSDIKDCAETNAGCVSEFVESNCQCRHLWSKQGVSLSQMYAGSDPHFMHFLLTGNLGPRDKFERGKLALYRWWVQNFYDGSKQDAISLITRQHDPELFNSKLESPFARRLSVMNKMVALGLFIALVAIGVNFFLAVLNLSFCRLEEIVICGALWLLYVVVLLTYILKDAISYTNYPLLT